MKNLENYGVHEMNAKDIKKTDGGFLLEVALLAVGLQCTLPVKQFMN